MIVPLLSKRRALSVRPITEQPSAQRALMDEIARRKALDTDPGVLSAIRHVGAAMLDNKSGSAQFVASQLPNTAVSSQVRGLQVLKAVRHLAH
jgi:hypothetical protein